MARIPSAVERLLLSTWRLMPLPKRLEEPLLSLVSKNFRVGILGIITDSRKRVMLFHHTYLNPQASWALPGGFAKEEDLRKALGREIKEESDLQVEVDKLIAIFHSPTRRNRINFLFGASITGGSFKPSNEVDAREFFDLGNLPENTGPDTRTILEALSYQNEDGIWINKSPRGYVSDITVDRIVERPYFGATVNTVVERKGRTPGEVFKWVPVDPKARKEYFAAKGMVILDTPDLDVVPLPSFAHRAASPSTTKSKVIDNETNT